MTKEVLKRYILLLLSIPVNAFGIVFITKAALGTSPISGVPFVLSLASPCSFGFYTLLLNIVFMIAEMALMGFGEVRKKKAELLLQLPIILIFSSSIDLSMSLLRGLAPSSYPQMLCSLFAGCTILATGIGWAVKAGVAMNPGEYVVNVICRKVGRPFGNVKLCFDATLVLVAAGLSLLFMHTITGLREGTVAAALLVGPLERMLYPAWSVFDRWFGSRPRGPRTNMNPKHTK